MLGHNRFKLSQKDEAFHSAVQSGLRRIQCWRVPPNWSRGDWLEELAAVGTAAAWEALCDFDSERGVPLARFAYWRMMSRCLVRYRKEWRYALHIDASVCWEEETTRSNHLGLAVSSPAKVNGSRWCENLRDAVGALSADQQRLLEQLFWQERTETEVGNTMNINQSTINRRKQAILKNLHMKLCDPNQFQTFSIRFCSSAI
jgi:RNA polymerase sigma factor (sigma-70 family)